MNRNILIGIFVIFLIGVGITTSISLSNFEDLPPETKEDVSHPVTEVVLVEHEILINDVNGLTSISKVIDCERFLDKAEQEAEINRIIKISIDESYSSFPEGAEIAVKVTNITGTSHTDQKDKYWDWDKKELVNVAKEAEPLEEPPLPPPDTNGGDLNG